MTASDVPAAIRVSRPANSTSAGTIRKPPPTPRKPVSSPTTKPARRHRHRRFTPCFTAQFIEFHVIFPERHSIDKIENRQSEVCMKGKGFQSLVARRSFLARVGTGLGVLGATATGTP